MTPVELRREEATLKALNIVRAGRDLFERMTIDLNTYEPGGGHKPNTHPEIEHVYYVVEGVMRAVVAEREYLVHPGEFVCIPRNTYHWHENAGEGRMTHILISAYLGDSKKGA